MNLPKIRNILHDKFLAAKVEHLQPLKALTVQSQEPVRSVIEMMMLNSVGSVLVVDKTQQLVGICTERDIIKKVALQEKLLMKAAVQEIMTPNPRTIRSHASVARALYEMVTGGFRHLPVLDASGKELRVISTKSFIDFVYSHVTKRIASNPLVQVLRDSNVDQFFLNEVSCLEPEKPVMLHEKAPLRSAIARLQTKNIGGVVAVNHAQKLVGIFTERDYLFRVASADLNVDDYTLAQLMTRSPQTVLINASISLAFNHLSVGGFRHLPVVDHSEELIGVLTIRNFMRFLSNEIVNELSSA
jgi:CBS domain-containing protein